MSWIGVGLVGGGVIAGVGGGILTQQQALQNAKNQANASNQILQTAIPVEEGYAATNEGVLNSDLGNYTPTSQPVQLAADQSQLEAANVDAISKPDMFGGKSGEDGIGGAGADIEGSTSRADAATRMGQQLDIATNIAKNEGKYAGYGDTWLTNQLNDAAAARSIGTTNTYSQLEGSLVPAETQLAQTGVWQPPSLAGTLLSGAGGIAASAGGAALGGKLGAPAPAAAPAPTGP